MAKLSFTYSVGSPVIVCEGSDGGGVRCLVMSFPGIGEGPDARWLVQRIDWIERYGTMHPRPPFFVREEYMRVMTEADFDGGPER
jgi:hypothetical protein